MRVDALPTQLKEEVTLDYVALCIANNIEDINKNVPKNDTLTFVFKSKDKA